MSAVLTVAMRPGARVAPAAGATESAFSFAATDFERVRRLMYQRTGVSLGAGKQVAIYSRLARRLRATGHQSFGSYLRWLEHASGLAAALEWREFVACLTADVNSFFRGEHQFLALAEEFTRRADQNLRIWCCAASTGEEAYSIAMTATETLGGGHKVRIVASDIDTRMLTTAAQGVYPANSPGLSRERLQAHFLPGKGLDAGLIRVKPGLARLIEFRQLEHSDSPWTLGEPFDIVFCRNVVDRLDAATRRRTLEGIHAAMKPRGLLFIGDPEDFGEASDLLVARRNSIYERI